MSRYMEDKNMADWVGIFEKGIRIFTDYVID